MKLYTKKLLSVLVSAMLVLGLMAPALASETSTPTTTTDPRIQITKVLNIGRGITIPAETFRFEFKPVNGSDEIMQQDTQGNYALGDITGYNDLENPAYGITQYPNIPDATVNYLPGIRSDDSTDTEIVLLTDVINLNDASINWPGAGLYIYSVKENASTSTPDMTYDPQTYYLKVMVSGSKKVTSLAVMGYDDAKQEWVKINGAPDYTKEENDDGCDDYIGNDFRFVNTYQKWVDKHPYNENDTTDVDDNGMSNYAFKLVKSISGTYTSDTDGFGFFVYVTFPDFYEGDRTVTLHTTRYVATQDLKKSDIDYSNETAGDPIDMNYSIIDNAKIPVHMRAGQTFSIDRLPAGTIIRVSEEAFVGKPYSPSYQGKWGLETDNPFTASEDKNKQLDSDEIVVGEKGAYIHFTNTVNDNDMTATGIVIDNLPYILMVGIALAGIGALTLSKKRRNG